MSDPADLFKGMACVEAAGGLDGFVREVLAEAKTLAMRTVRQNPSDSDPMTVLEQSFNSVIMRRMEPDLKAELWRESCRMAEAAQDRCDGSLDAAVAKASDVVAERISQRIQAVFAAMHY